MKDYSLDDLISGLRILNEDFYIPKAFILVSESPYFREYEEILYALHSKSKNDISFPYDFYLRQITYMVPKPGRGSIVTFPGLNPKDSEITAKIQLGNSRRNELPTVCSYYYWNVFATTDYLTFDDNFLMALYWFLCQVGSTVLISKYPKKLVTMAETLRTIIFPFEYDDSYMPVISRNNYGYLAAPFPLVVGVIVTSEEEQGEVEAMVCLHF